MPLLPSFLCHNGMISINCALSVFLRELTRYENVATYLEVMKYDFKMSSVSELSIPKVLLII